eukprot:CAMPEP_0181314334 /NCGR_PEP_ID=MMETSP1101-20121128/14761_1 /TAXON_ID=46948 /ORGANISM="Rhodomonas abbreviata, Strain Caron Lab Isolate" /LENGTH=174 /DNA_ID=CAMNT_0023421417 /DNA_START=142 /DNA_END=663 /DNA_ORIENTATION=+
MDSGSPVDLTYIRTHANLTYGEQVQLEGVLPGKTAVEPPRCDIENRIPCYDVIRWVSCQFPNRKTYVDEGKNVHDEDLVFVMGGINFLWASPSTSLSSPELLVEEFLASCVLRQSIITPCRPGRKEPSESSAWIYAFRLDRVVRVSDLKFYEKLLPFRDPSVLVNPKSSIVEDV